MRFRMSLYSHIDIKSDFFYFFYLLTQIVWWHSHTSLVSGYLPKLSDDTAIQVWSLITYPTCLKTQQYGSSVYLPNLFADSDMVHL